MAGSDLRLTAGHHDRPLRRAPLPFQLQLPRRGVASRGARRRGGPARPRRPRPHRPRRPVRGGPLRRDGRALGLPSVFGAELTLVGGEGSKGPVPAPPTPPGPTWWSWPATPRATPASAGPSPRPIWPAGRRADPPARSRTWRSTWPAGQGGHWLVLTGCRKGAVPTALTAAGPAAAARELDRLVEAFGRENVAVELWDHGDPLDTARNDALAQLAVSQGPGHGGHQQRPLRHRRPGGRWPPPWPPCGPGGRWPSSTAGFPRRPPPISRSGVEQERRFARWPGAVARAAELGRACAFDLRLVAPGLPDFRVPAGHDEQSWLVELVRRGAHRPLRPAGHRAGTAGHGPRSTTSSR